MGLRDGALLVGQATTGSVGYTILLIAGTRLTSAGDAGVIVGILPAAAAITAVALLGERLSSRTVAAVALATVGLFLVFAAPSSSSAGSGSLIGDLLVLGAVMCECLFILLNKRLTVSWPPLALSAAMTGLGLLISGVAALPGLLTHWNELPLTPFMAIVYYALIPTVGGFWLWYAGSARVSGGEAAVFTAIAPITAVLLAWLFPKEPLTLARIGGLAAVVLAVIVIAIRSGPPARVGEAQRHVSD